MNPENIPLGDRILPDTKCAECREFLEIIFEAGDEDDTIFISCPNKGTEKDAHTDYTGVSRSDLIIWGWKI